MARRFQFSLRTALLLVFVVALLVRPANNWIRAYVVNRGLVSVKGRVTFEGQPLADARVVMVPVNSAAKTVQGVTKADGSYELETLTTPGDYGVAIVEVGTGPGRLPAKYASATTSRLTVPVRATRENHINIDVTQ